MRKARELHQAFVLALLEASQGEVALLVGDAVGGFHRVVALPYHNSGVGQSSLFVANRTAQRVGLGYACH